MRPGSLVTEEMKMATNFCTRFFRNRSLPAIGLILALLILLCWWALQNSQDSAPVAEHPVGGAGGNGSASGAAQTGAGHGSDAMTIDDKPQGDGKKTAISGASIASPSAETTIQRPLPRIGFTPIEDAETPPPSPATVTAPAGGTGQGSSSGSPGGSGTEFMGVKTDANRIVYILDFSGSMSDGVKLDRMLLELKKSVNRLPSDHYFYIVFFDDQALPMPVPALVQASVTNKNLYFAWADTESIGAASGGGTDPSTALELVLKTMRPQAIYLLTDGMFVDNDKVFSIINRENVKRKVQINTIALHDRSNEIAMQRIAAENHGEYRYVPPPP